MSYLAYDDIHGEIEFQTKPSRSDEGFWWDFFHTGRMLETGTIRKMIGRDLKWEDNPCFIDK